MVLELGGIKMNTKKIFGTLVGLNILQIAFTLIIIVLMQNNHQSQMRYVIYGSCLFLGLNALVTIISYAILNKAKNTSLLESMKNIEALNSTLRSQRHDYLNQIQIVHGLLELEEYEEAKIYMDSIFKEIMKVSKALKTAQPAINALFQAKLQMAEGKGIDMYLDIKSDLKDLEIEPWELCKVLANIIDNGITALAQKEGRKEMHVKIEQETNQYIIIISNNGPRIPSNKLDTIFIEGYSTKKEKGHGMGLTIVKNIMIKARAKLEVESRDEETTFSLSFPKISTNKLLEK